TNWLTMGMILSSPMVLAGIWAMATAKPVAQPQAA
ncbi:prolipoprotein diacylglyceryl transferase, partial [Mesorhizobium sp. M7A.F.Ca.US.001.04.1.1]